MTRLHAKAWLFHRRSRFSTAYIGSSNLTHSAEVSGLEWNVRVSGARNPDVIAKVGAVFESYWNSGDFVPYQADEFAAQTAAQAHPGASLMLSPIELRPEVFHERLLEQIALSRQQGHHRNLLVSATGNGKDRHGGDGLRPPARDAAPGFRARLRVDPEPARGRARGAGAEPFRCGHRRRVSPRRREDLPGAARTPAADRAARAHRDPRAQRRPPGARLFGDRVAAEIVLRNVREAVPSRWTERVDELRRLSGRAGRKGSAPWPLRRRATLGLR
jgi:hypothetical protein